MIFIIMIRWDQAIREDDDQCDGGEDNLSKVLVYEDESDHDLHSYHDYDDCEYDHGKEDGVDKYLGSRAGKGCNCRWRWLNLEDGERFD